MQLRLGDFVFYSLYIGSGSPQEKLLYMTFPHAVWVLARDGAYGPWRVWHLSIVYNCNGLKWMALWMCDDLFHLKRDPLEVYSMTMKQALRYQLQWIEGKVFHYPFKLLWIVGCVCMSIQCVLFSCSVSLCVLFVWHVEVNNSPWTGNTNVFVLSFAGAILIVYILHSLSRFCILSP